MRCCNMRSNNKIEPPVYLAYLLRLWQTGQGDQPAYRDSLEEAGNGIRYGFGSLDELVEFLKARLSEKQPPYP